MSESKTMKRLVALCALLMAGSAAGGALAQRPASAVDHAITFTKDIAPILYDQCAPCHRPDGPAPFSLIAYADARQRAAQIAAVTKRRYMPPWKPEPGFGDLVGERRLTESQIETLDRWAKTGALEGNPSDTPPPPTWSAGWQRGEPDLVVTLPEYTLRPDGTDVFRNFVVTVPGTTVRYVRGLEFRPGHRAVHHANIRVDPTPASRQLDEADPAPGYEGAILRTADYPDGHFLGWTPGQITPLAPPGLGWRLDAGSHLVVQLHLQPTGKVERIRPSIAFYFTADAPARVPTMVRLGRQNLDIPAGAAAHRVVDAYVLPVDAEVRGIQPHAHYRARSVSAWATRPGGARVPLILIRNWDFNWQDQYQYAAPFWLPAGTKLEMEYVFDNSDDNPRNPDHPARRVTWGWRSSDEMADVWIQVMTRTESDRARLDRDVRRKMAGEDLVGCETLIAREPDHADLHNDAASLYLELGRPEQALEHFVVVSRLQPESAVARYNVGVALEAAGRTAEAARQYEAAIERDSAYSVAHNNLGSLLVGQGRLDEARRHFERAVASRPANAEAQNNLGAMLLASGDAGAAIAHLREATRLRAAYPEAHFNLARAYASMRQFDEAIHAATTAEDQAIAAAKADLTAQIREQLRLYRAGVKP